MNPRVGSGVPPIAEDTPEHELRRGHLCTIVEEIAPGTYEVEFSDDEGRPFAIDPLKPRPLSKLRTTPSPTLRPPFLCSRPR